MSERREHSRNFIRMTGLYPKRNPFILRTHEILMRHKDSIGSSNWRSAPSLYRGSIGRDFPQPQTLQRGQALHFPALFRQNMNYQDGRIVSLPEYGRTPEHRDARQTKLRLSRPQEVLMTYNRGDRNCSRTLRVRWCRPHQLPSCRKFRRLEMASYLPNMPYTINYRFENRIESTRCTFGTTEARERVAFS